MNVQLIWTKAIQVIVRPDFELADISKLYIYFKVNLEYSHGEVIKQSLDKVSRERDELVSQNGKLREENHLMLSSHESLKQEHIASLQQLDETQVQLQSQGEELRQLREASDQVQTSQSESSEKLQKVLNENCQLEKNLQEIEILNQNYATKVDKLQ